MSDGSLSQDEIDALLQGTDDSSADSGGLFSDNIGTSVGGAGAGLLSQAENSAFLDLINSSSGNVGGALGALIGKVVTVGSPRLEVLSGRDISNQMTGQFVEVVMDYESGVVGHHSYILDADLAKNIAGFMMGQEFEELTDMEFGAVSEAMNVLSGNSSNTIGAKVKKELRTSPPLIGMKDSSMMTVNSGDNYVKVVYDFSIEGTAPTKLIEIFGLNVVKDLTSSIVPASNQMGGNVGVKSAAGGSMGQAMNMGGMPQNMGMMNMGGMPQNMGMMNMGGMPQNMGMMNMGGMPQNQFQNVQFSSFQPAHADAQGGNINLLMDVNMELTVELGRTKKSIKEILGMGEGTVIELDKLAGEPVDILVNGKLIARGEVVVIDENFGVRVTEIINPMDRIRDL
ncbi:MAG TPA: flagellar motor switch phosphatase FliY [Spirochaetota bacterium]|jgi:flagellar motor switch protein FliN/FliY|nr:MAG: Flagellar motor switch protein FliN [Spirochaetes bacterium ADurb.Bin133]HNZ27598.1 flagellar motor switch phosphatase FliY [Spirochaetota bacterium]HOS33077.1 flagellar motor switch phosphatase FliY [Spirochaetota bacterium]HOS56332.1 flagellar motor switch phosphatase FliY [Spirochaetota bacterium]HPY87307.1 flagellar motor switch phosphatase FliY [Spirochaetota bacterium]